MKKIPYKQSAKILSYFDVSPEAVSLISGDLAPEAVITALHNAQLNIDLAAFYAHALPMREAIWWATQATALRRKDLTDAENRLIEDCAAWVKQPNEAARRDIERRADHFANESCAKWVALAVFWSGQGSIAPLGNPVVMPADFLHAKAVAGAVNTAAALPEWDGYKGYYKKVFQMATDIAQGGSGKMVEEQINA